MIERISALIARIFPWRELGRTGRVGQSGSVRKAELKLSEQRYRTLVDSVTDYGIFYLSPEGFVSSWNKGAEKLKGYRPEEIIGRHFSVFYPEELLKQDFPAYELEVAKKEGRFENEGWRVRKDGSKFWANVIITAMRDEQGELIGFSKITRDLTEHKRVEEELRAMNEKLEHLVTQKTASLRKSLKREQLAVMLTNSIRSELDMDTVVLKTIRLLGKYTMADRCVFWPFNDQFKQFTTPFCEYHGSESEEIRYIRDTHSSNRPLLPKNFGPHDIVNIYDAQQINNFSEEDWKCLAERKIRSLLSIPVLFDEHLLGRIQIHAIFQNRMWDQDTVDLVQQVADQVAVAIHHAQIIQSLRESEARKSAIMDSALDAIIIMDEAGNVVEWNTSAERLFGYTRDEILGQRMGNFIIPERYRLAHHRGLAHYIETGEGPVMNQLLELPALRADGSEFLTELTITRIPIGGPALFTGVLRDITERKRSEQALIESEERFRLMADSAPIMIWMMNPQLEVTYSNRTALSYGEGEVLKPGMGKGWEQWVHPDDIQFLIESMNKASQTKEKFSVESRLRVKSGAYRWVVSTGVPRLDTQGDFLGFVGSTVDIHEHKIMTESLENRVQERTAQLQVANKELEAFSYSVSHDLRAPLRTIDGFSQAVLEMYGDKLDARGQDYLGRIRQGSQQMAKLIDDMLQLSRLTRGALNLEDGINLSRIANDIAETFQAEEPQRQVAFEIEHDLQVRGDKRLLQVVIQNLMANAWKYTSKHETAHIEFGHLESPDAVIYYVRDDGAGFDMQYADKLFGAFQRLHGVDEFPGNGIGLATVARIVHRHGGEVWADAEVEKGATIYFTLQAINSQEMENAKSFRQSYSTR